MRRELPAHPHIDHLKKQAKDLLDAHGRGDAEALARIVTSLPSFKGRSVDEARAMAFALHDAQSTIAREYGFPSWNDLRLEVERRANPAVPDGLLRALAGQPLPPAVTAALADTWAARGQAPDLSPESQRIPLLAFRNALLTPGAVAPINVARTSSLAAIDAALRSNPPLLAVFTQRDADNEAPGLDDFYAAGCVALVIKRVVVDAGTFLVVQGLAWASLDSLEPPEPSGFSVAHLTPFEPLMGELAAAERDALVASLRDRAHRLAAAMPQPERVIALVDSIRVPERLSDLIVANLPCPVADKARYAAERSLAERLRTAIALCDAQLHRP